MNKEQKIDNIPKGLLLAVVLFCLYSSCSTSSTQRTNNLPLTDSIPNAMHYLLFGSGRTSSKVADSISLEELALLQDGDILLRKGYGSISDYIADFLQEKYPVTHCGFFYYNSDSLPFVLHTISNDSINGMYLEPLNSYIRQSQKGSLVAIRLKRSTNQIKEVLNSAQVLLKQKIPFDLGFDDRNKESLYCVEMMRNIFLEVFEQDLLPKRTQKQTIDVLSMDNFFDSTYFEVVFNHFVTNKE